MKRIEQIERMSAQQLEAEAMKMEVRVPQELRADIEAMLAAQQFEGNQTEDRAKRRVSGSSSEQRRRKARRRGFAATAGSRLPRSGRRLPPPRSRSLRHIYRPSTGLRPGGNEFQSDAPENVPRHQPNQNRQTKVRRNNK